MYPYGAPQPPADPAALPRLLAGLLGVLAAGLIVVGSFLPSTTYVQLVDDKPTNGQSISAWSRSFDVEPDAESKKFYDNTHVARYGIPLAGGALVLLAGAGLAVAGLRRTAGDRVKSGSRSALLIGAAGVAGAVWMFGMDVSATLTYEQHEGSIQTRYTTGIGFWLLLGGGVVAVAVLGFALLAGRKPAMPRQFAAYQPAVQPPGGYGGPPSQPFAAQPPGSQPFPAQPYPGSQPFPAQPPASQPFPAQPYPGQPPMSQPFAAQPPPPHPSARDQPPTEPNYQLPPLDPPNT